MNQETPVDALIRAIAEVKTQSALAAGLTAASKARGGEEITAARIWNWVNRDKKAPAEFCPDIEELTGVCCEELAPDVNWAVLRKSKKQKRQQAYADITQPATETVANQGA